VVANLSCCALSRSLCKYSRIQSWHIGAACRLRFCVFVTSNMQFCNRHKHSLLNALSHPTTCCIQRLCLMQKGIFRYAMILLPCCTINTSSSARRSTHLYADVALDYGTNVSQKSGGLASASPDAAAIDNASTQDLVSWETVGFQMLQRAARLGSTYLKIAGSFLSLLMQRWESRCLMGFRM
jgi:hypothetical protein